MTIRSKPATKAYRSNFDRLFKRRKQKKAKEAVTALPVDPETCHHGMVVWDPDTGIAVCGACGKVASSVKELRAEGEDE